MTRFPSTAPATGLYYWIKGMETGYLKSSPFDAFILAIMIQMTLRTTRVMMIGMPTMIKQSGAARTVYRSIDISKFIDALPLRSTHCDSSFLDNQQIRGPIILPKGKKNPANADRWQNIAQFLSLSDNSMISFMMLLFT